MVSSYQNEFSMVAMEDSWTQQDKKLREQSETKSLIVDTREAQASSLKQLGDSWKASSHNNLCMKEEHNLIL